MEKDCQLAIMGRVYSNATKMIAYLGADIGNRNGEKCLSLLEKLRVHYKYRARFELEIDSFLSQHGAGLLDIFSNLQLFQTPMDDTRTILRRQ